MGGEGDWVVGCVVAVWEGLRKKGNQLIWFTDWYVHYFIPAGGQGEPDSTTSTQGEIKRVLNRRGEGLVERLAVFMVAVSGSPNLNDSLLKRDCSHE